MSVALGNQHSLVLDLKGNVWGFGVNSNGQLGTEEMDNPGILRKVPELSNVVNIACGGRHSACVDADGCVWTFGCNDVYQCCISHGRSPERVPGLQKFNIISVHCGMNFTMCIDASQHVHAFGGNDFGQLGMGDKAVRRVPTMIPLVESVRTLSCGARYVIFLLFNGNILACGDNKYGQLGLGDISSRYYPTPNETLHNIAEIACGNAHTMVLNNEGEVYSFGRNNRGNLGYQDEHGYTSIPTIIAFDSVPHSIHCGSEHSFILDTEGSLWSFGSNFAGQLGNGDTHNQFEPVLTINNVCLVVAGGFHNIVKTIKGDAYGFGYNGQNQLGIITGERRILSPVLLPKNLARLLTPWRPYSQIKSARK